MKLNNGIWQDSNLVDQPNGSPFYGKNGVQISKIGSRNNENGFKFSNINEKASLTIGNKIPETFQPIGTIGMESKIIVFSTNNIGSEIGIYDSISDTYKTLINDSSLGFSLDHPIEGTWTANFKGETVISWTDNYNPIRVLNTDIIPSPFNTNKIDIFKNAKVPVNNDLSPFNYTVNVGGNFTGTGAFFPYIQYRNYQGDATAWIPVENIVFTDGANQSITLTFNNIDQNYDTITIAFYYILNDVVYEREFRTVAIASTSITTTITGFESFIDLTQGTLLIPSLDYRTARTVTEISKQLAAANLTSATPIKYQKYACNIKLYWRSEIISYDTFSTAREDKGYCHDEIMSYYIRFRLLNGNYTEAFHIPGPSLDGFNVNDLNQIITINGDNIKAYQINDFATITNTTNNDNCEGNFSYFENLDEVYPVKGLTDPKLEEFNGAFDYNGNPIIGGRNLITETCLNGTGKVKHHKFPSLQTHWEYYRSKGHSEYGLSKLDRLGLIVDTDTIFIPIDIQAQIQSYEIFYADRNLANQTIIAQDLALLCGQANGSGLGERNLSTGCNFGTLGATGSSFDNMELRYDILRNHSFDLFANKNASTQHAFPAISPSHVKFNFNIKSPFVYGTTQIGKHNNSGESIFVATRADNGSSTEKYTGANSIKKIKAYNYVGCNTITTVKNADFNPDNRLQEGCFWMQLFDNVPFFNQNLWPAGDLDYVSTDGSGISSGINLYTEQGADTQKSANYNLFVLKPNVYEKFTDQDLIGTGYIFKLGTTGRQLTWGGDIFLTIQCVNTYGIWYYNQIYDNPNDGLQGIKGYHFYIAESINSASKRRNYVPVSGNSYNNFGVYYTPFAGNQEEIWDKLVLNDGIDAQTDYRYDYNYEFSSSLNKITSSVFNPNNAFSNRFPNRIIRSLAQNNDTKELAWSIFKVNDYYDIRRNRGEITNIEQFQANRLLIHTTQALFITINRTELATDSVKVTLGTSDLFSNEPEEIIFTDKGSLGLQHRDAGIVTPMGYFFIDGSAKKSFLVTGSSSQDIKEISAQGLRNFFLDGLQSISNDYNSLGISKIVSGYDVVNNRIIVCVKNGQKTFTISYTNNLAEGQGGWAFFHDYFPDLICSTRYDILSFKKDITNESNLYIHNRGTQKGIYYKESLTNQIPKSFFIDVIFNAYQITQNGKKETSLNNIFQSIRFKTECQNIISKYLETFTHITVRTEYQCSGRIPVQFIDEIGEGNLRKTEDYWKFNKFRDLVRHDPNNPNDFQTFVQDIYNQYDVISSSLDFNKDEFEQKRFTHPYIIVRFEYDNVNNSEISLIECDTNNMNEAR